MPNRENICSDKVKVITYTWTQPSPCIVTEHMVFCLLAHANAVKEHLPFDSASFFFFPSSFRWFPAGPFCFYRPTRVIPHDPHRIFLFTVFKYKCKQSHTAYMIIYFSKYNSYGAARSVLEKTSIKADARFRFGKRRPARSRTVLWRPNEKTNFLDVNIKERKWERKPWFLMNCEFLSTLEEPKEQFSL